MVQRADIQHMEDIIREVMTAFDVVAPPIPVELMLQKPPAGMWEDVDVTQLSGSFLSIKDRYSPRMSMARLLAKHIAGSDWGRERGLFDLISQGQEHLNAFARGLLMPQEMVESRPANARNPTTMSLHFEVPEDDARQRLLELFD